MTCVASMDGYFERLNSAWTTHLVWSVDELLAKPFMEFVHPDDCELTIDTLGTLNEGVKTILFENRYLHRDGSYRWMQWNAQPEPETKLIYASARDITRQRELEREILTISDREKEHLGQELHDGLCQTLAGIAALSMTLARTASASTNISRTATEINLLLNSAVRDTRDLARGLAPVGLTEDGLARALEILTTNVQNLFRVFCKLECITPFIRLQPDIEKQLFRIAQEAFNNSIAHGHAKQITITLEAFDTQGRLCISDDGVGLHENSVNATGMGLQTMIYRARLINGTLQVHARSTGGSIPLIEKLSDLELQVFQLIGKGTRQIAEFLCLSIKTIESHQEHIKQKLAIETSVELTRRATLWHENAQLGTNSNNST